MSEWVKENGFWYYYDSDGVMATGWVKSRGYWYYCYDDGSMARDTMVDGYYVNDDGQWTKDEGSREIIDGNDDHFWYYIGNSGKAVTGWNKIGDVFHYYNYPGGSMTRNNTIDGFDIDDYGNIVSGTGWLKDEYSGEWYYFSDGEMKTGWQYVNGDWYYLYSDGEMATGWVNDGTGWYFLYNNGSMAHDSTFGGYHVAKSGKMVTGTGWQFVDGSWYYLDSNGEVETNWQNIDGLWYYFYPQGSMAKDTTIDGWNVDDSGRWITYGETEIGDSQEVGKVNTGPTLEEAAEIAANVYSAKAGDDPILGGWQIIGDPIIKGSLQMAIYGKIGPDGKMEYVVANAGTDPTSGSDWKNNAEQPFGNSPDMWNSLTQAEEFVNNHYNANITFVGHSKGGAEAAGNAVYMDRNAIVFNPAAINLDAYKLNSSDYHADMTAYIVKGEALNDVEGWISESIGKVVYLPTQYPIIPETHSDSVVDQVVIKPINTADAIANHLMPSVQNAIKQNETGENVIISRTVDNKAKEIGKEINEALKNPKVQQFFR